MRPVLPWVLAAALCGANGAALASPFGTTSENSVAKDMNKSGATALDIADNAGYRRAILRQDGSRIELGTFGGRESVMAGINNSGTATGSAQTSDGAWRAFRYTPSGGMRQLDTLGGRSSNATAINERGDIVGHSDTYNGTYHAFVDTGITLLDLGTLGGKNSYATAVNANGMVVGAAENAGGYRRAFMYKPGIGMFELPGIGERHSVATGVNDSGVIVGAMMMPNRRWHAFKFDGHRTIDLGTMLDARSSSFATAINNHGDVAGKVQPIGQNSPMVFVYSGGQMQVRDNYARLDLAHRITDDGQIIGASMIAQKLQAARMARHQVENIEGPSSADYLTYAFLAILATVFMYKIRDHLREGIDFSKRLMLSIA